MTPTDISYQSSAITPCMEAFARRDAEMSLRNLLERRQPTRPNPTRLAVTPSTELRNFFLVTAEQRAIARLARLAALVSRKSLVTDRKAAARDHRRRRWTQSFVRSQGTSFPILEPCSIDSTIVTGSSTIAASDPSPSLFIVSPRFLFFLFEAMKEDYRYVNPSSFSFRRNERRSENYRYVNPRSLSFFSKEREKIGKFLSWQLANKLHATRIRENYRENLS